MWLNIPKHSAMINLDLYREICIVTLNEEKGLYNLVAYENGHSNYTRLTAPCSLSHAQNQYSNIIRDLSRGAAICRIYDEYDETTE